MKRWLRTRTGSRVDGFVRSDELGQRVKERDGSEEAVDVLHEADLPETEGGKNPSSDGDDFVATDTSHDRSELLKEDEGLRDFRWEVRHGSGSLRLTGLALIFLVAADLVHPDGSHAGRVFGGFGTYLAGASVAFALERRDHRKQRALLPVDRSGGGRLGLVLTAIVLGTVADEEFRGLAVWIALSAVLVGSWADGAWLAIAAGRRGIGPLRAWMVLARGERDARKHLWAALFGRGGHEGS